MKYVKRIIVILVMHIHTSISGFHNTGVNSNIGAINALTSGSISLYLADNIPIILVKNKELIKSSNNPAGKLKII